MADIVKAIEIEKEYIEYRMKGEEPFHLIDAVKECGFETLEEFFKAKKQHAITRLDFEFIETTPFKAIDEVMKAIALKKPAVIMVNIDHTVVWPTKSEEYDKDYCIAEGLPLLPTGTETGGALVSTPGDLGIGICLPRSIEADVETIADMLVSIFRKHTDKDVRNDGNDVMVGGFKVCGITYYETADVFMAITPISITEKRGLVSKVCLKAREKEVGYIDFMGRDKIREEVSEWLRGRSI